MKNILTWSLIFILTILTFSCKQEKSYDFDNIPDRIWPGEDFWTIPLEDWQVRNGRLETVSQIQNASVSILPYVLNESRKSFRVSVEMGLLAEGGNPGSAGLMIGAEAIEEKDVRSAVYFGQGINAGVNTKGSVFFGAKTEPLPENFDMKRFRIEVAGKNSSGGYILTLRLYDDKENLVSTLEVQTEENPEGIIKLLNNFVGSGAGNDGPKFWFDNLVLEGAKLENRPENSFGPVLWTMHTLSRNTLKMTAQLPPVSQAENQEAVLQIKEGSAWTTLQSGKMDPDARTVTWKIQEWDSKAAKSYRILFDYINASGNQASAEYTGEIRKEPENKMLRLGALTCQYHYGFPYSPLVKNLELSNADLLYFSGDQIYEQNGGYPIKRTPEDKAILSYLGKWYMFGWAFGDLMRDIPTICTPDDHDVFHGNLWGEEGLAFPGTGTPETGFAQTVKFVDMVNRTNCAHLPDPYDPEPIAQGMKVWYTSLNYGRISFAIVSDRIFKSSPTRVATWKTRSDHLLKPLKDLSIIDNPQLKLFGERQEKFLEEWIRDWRDADMKVLLSQTLFANVATHHGSWDGYLYGDLDSGGWPKTARDKAVDILRRGFVFHVAGDQHVPSIVQYGIDEFHDAGWCYVTPAIAVGYSRWFRPDELGIPVVNRPDHGYPNTGEYTDGFGNLNYVYAIGNPVNFTPDKNRFELAQIKSSGYGMVIFNSAQRTITMESWRFLADLKNPQKADQHPGWPLTISQFDNYGRKAVAYLPTLKINGEPDPVVEIFNQKTGDLEYSVRIKGNEFDPKVFSNDAFSIRIGYPEKDLWKTVDNLKALKKIKQEALTLEF